MLKVFMLVSVTLLGGCCCCYSEKRITDLELRTQKVEKDLLEFQEYTVDSFLKY